MPKKVIIQGLFDIKFTGQTNTQRKHYEQDDVRKNLGTAYRC